MTVRTLVTVPSFSGENLRLCQKRKNGEKINRNDILYTIEFDALGMDCKAEAEFPATTDGVLQWLIDDNATVDFGDQIAVIEK
jgi:hypothetical protein